MYVCMHGPNVHTSKARVCSFLGYIEESYIPSMYVCPAGKHTYLENKRYVWYVWMSGERYIPRKEEACMYVCMYVCIVRTYRPQKHGYECSSET